MKSERIKYFSNHNVSYSQFSHGKCKTLFSKSGIKNNMSKTNFEVIFKNKTQYLNDPSNKYNYKSGIVNISSSSNTSSSSDALTSSCSSNSPSSLSYSSDNSSEFNEVEKIIEEYFTKKLTKSSVVNSKSFNLKGIKTKTKMISAGYIHESFENNPRKRIYKLTSEAAVQVSENDFKKKNSEILKSSLIFKSQSYNSLFLPEIWIFHNNFKLYLNKSNFNEELNNLFQNSYYLMPILKKNKYSENMKDANYSFMKYEFNKMSFYKKYSNLYLNIDQISPLKAIFLINRKTSKILQMNDKAKFLFKLPDLQYANYFNSLLVYKYKYVNIWDYFVDKNGIICCLPSQMVLCKDFYQCYIIVSIRLQKLSNIMFKTDYNDNIIVVVEPLIINEGLCFINNEKIHGYNDIFTNMFGLSDFHFKDVINSTRLFSSKLAINNLNVNQKISHNILKPSGETLPLYFLSKKLSITSNEANYFDKNKTITKSNDFMGIDYFHLYAMWYYNNLTGVITVSPLGEIIDFDPYFPTILGYTNKKLNNAKINTILKFNSFDFDPIYLLQSSVGKYEATLSHSNGSLIKCIIWITKQDHIDKNIIYVLWVLRDSNNLKNLNGIRWHSKVEIEGSINLEDLTSQFNFLNFNTKKDNLKFLGCIKSQNEDNHRNSKANSLSILKKQKSVSLPELNNSVRKGLSPWTAKTSRYLLNSDTSSNGSENSKDICFRQNTDIFYNYYKLENIIGKGAFGFVRLAKSIKDEEEFVVKFIRKSKLSIEHMVKVPLKDVNNLDRRFTNGFETAIKDKKFQITDEIQILVPREIFMLCILKHHNIVSLYDWYEGIDHFQMIMPKHGVGMDLFEFIDRSPIIDEPLACYIFRQLVDAVVYLHSSMISHRDIKDENVILDNQFNIKLIDFGAAVKVEAGQKFKTFCGTMEFCSPEILLGNEYNAFHADIWSLGITLYTIMFGENPFYDFEETINAILKPPKEISSDLHQILSCLLEPNPAIRITADKLIQHSWINQEVNIIQYNFETIVPNPEFSGNIASDFRKYSNDSNNDIIYEKPINHICRKNDLTKQETY